MIPGLTETLRSQGATLEVSEIAPAKKVSWPEMLINFSPILLIAGLWIFVMRRFQNRRNPPQQGTLSNRALG